MTAAARIHDRGYSRYTDERTGTGGAVRSLYRQTLQQALGFRRSVWQKILPFLSIVLAYLPAIAFVGMAAFANTQPRVAAQVQELLPTYAEYYGFVYAAILVFVAFVAPELLCADRRTGMLGLYLASPLTRGTYLVARGAGTLTLLLLVTLGPPLLMLVANTLNGTGPTSVGEFLTTLGQVLVSGVVIGAFYGALSLAVASLTTRRAFATVGIVFILFGSSVLTQLLIRRARFSQDLFLANLLLLPLELVFRIFGESGHINRTASEAQTLPLALAWAGWTGGCALLVWLRYRRLEVTR